MKIFHFVTIGCAAGAILAFAQNAAPVGGVPVQTVITAESRESKDLRINREDVLVSQGHDRSQVTQWTSCETDKCGLELYVLIDDAVSSSVGIQLTDIKRFIEHQPPSAEIGIAYLKNGSAEIRQAPTADHAKASAALRVPLSSAASATSPYLSLSDLIKHWPAKSQRREVVMITSGDDPLGGSGVTNPYVDGAIEDAQRAGVVVYSIFTPGIGHAGHSYWRQNWGENHLAQLAEETGAEAYVMGLGPPVSFAPYFDDLADHLAHQYLLTFLAMPGKKASLESFKVTTETPNVELIAPHRVLVPVTH